MAISFFPVTCGTAGIPSLVGITSLLWLPEGFHRHTLFLSKRGRGLSSTPHPAAQGYQLSHPDVQITNELTAPASRHTELEGGEPALGWGDLT